VKCSSKVQTDPDLEGPAAGMPWRMAMVKKVRGFPLLFRSRNTVESIPSSSELARRIMEPTERDTIADESNIRRNRSDPTQRKFKYKPPSDRSVNPLKKRQRDLTRLLGHSDSLPADVRIGYERELASCRHDLQIAQDKLRRNQMIKKYHMVRFFG